MSSRRRVRPTVSSVGRVLVLLVALAGLFAMHGLSDHGTAGPGEVGGVATAAAAAGEHDPGAMHRAAGEGPGPRGGHDMTMAGACLAVLVTVLLLGLTFLRGGPGVGSWRPDRLAGLTRSVREKVPRPPDLIALSILRC